MPRGAVVLPFTAEQFFEVFARYNAAVWPAPVVAYLLGAVAVLAVLSGHRAGNIVAAMVLTSFWAWTGIAYHWLAFAAINKAAWLFGALFVVEAALLAWFARQLEFGFRAGSRGLVGLAFIAYAAILYPLLGLAAGHVYPAMPLFGVTPCPVTIFTFGLLLIARRPPWPLLIVPVLWSLVGGSAAFLLRVPQDWLLLVTGPLTLVLLWRARAAAS
jgi:hypothetical protein